MPGPTGHSQVSSPPSSIAARFAMSLPRPLRLLLLIVLSLLAVLIALVYSLTWRPLPVRRQPCHAVARSPSCNPVRHSR